MTFTFHVVYNSQSSKYVIIINHHHQRNPILVSTYLTIVSCALNTSFVIPVFNQEYLNGGKRFSNNEISKVNYYHNAFN